MVILSNQMPFTEQKWLPTHLNGDPTQPDAIHRAEEDPHSP
jgi:hypothetical protein